MIRSVVIIELYHSLLVNNTFSKYLTQKGYQVKAYAFFKQEKERFISKKSYILREAVCFLKLLFTFGTFRNKKTYCLGGYYATLFIMKLFGWFLGRNFHLYIYNFYLHQAGEKKQIQQILRFLLKNRRCTLIVQSPKEIEYYKQLTSIPVYFVPYCAPEKKVVPTGNISLPPDDYIFTGGYTNRDYKNVLLCAQKMKDVVFVLAVSGLNTEIKVKTLPSNIILYTDLDRNDFEYLLSHAAVVLVPLKDDVGSSGQMLCLSAMQQKKAIVYSDVSAVNYYLEGKAGLPYQIGDVKSMQQALQIALLDTQQRIKLGEQAYANYIRSYTIESQNEQLLAVFNEA